MRAVIGFQSFNCLDFGFRAERIATNFAIKEHNADGTRVASAGVYINSAGVPCIVQDGTLQSTRWDPVICKFVPSFHSGKHFAL